MSNSDRKLQDRDIEVGFWDPDDFLDFVSSQSEDEPSQPAGRPSRTLASDEAGSVESEDFQPEESEEDLEYYNRVQENAKEYVAKRQEDTRGRLAIIYTLATFFIFLLGFIVAILDALINKTSMISNLTEILPLISGIFLGSLGFVIGYYFRKDEEDKGR